jgi:hypothetical protein
MVGIFGAMVSLSAHMSFRPVTSLRFTIWQLMSLARAVIQEPLVMPSIRYTLKSLILLVALMAIIWGIWIREQRLSRLSAQYTATAADYENKSRWVNRGTSVDTKGRYSHVEFPTPNKQFYLDLKAKYEHAARFPWLPLDPVPSEPDLTGHSD